MSTHHHINYVEFAAENLEATKAFFSKVFAWEFQDFGAEYTSFKSAGIEGGFFKAKRCASIAQGSALVVLYSKNLEASQEAVVKAGGSIIEAIFSFPGGRRFHFQEPSGNELAIWSDVGCETP